MDILSQDQYLNDSVIIGLATTVLTEIAKRSNWKLLSKVDPTNKNQLKFVAGGISLVLVLVRKIQSGEINQGNFLLSVKTLFVSWAMAWALSYFAYQGLPYTRTVKPEDENVAVSE